MADLRCRPASGAAHSSSSSPSALILLIPLMYILLTVFDVQRGAYGAAAAARAGARAYNLAGSQGESPGAAMSALRTSAEQALEDQGVRQWATGRLAAVQRWLPAAWLGDHRHRDRARPAAVARHHVGLACAGRSPCRAPAQLYGALSGE